MTVRKCSNVALRRFAAGCRLSSQQVQIGRSAAASLFRRCLRRCKRRHARALLSAAAARLPPAFFPCHTFAHGGCERLRLPQALSQPGRRPDVDRDGEGGCTRSRVRALSVARGRATGCSLDGCSNAATLELIDTHDADVPTGLQLLAKNEGEVLGALQRLEQLALSSCPHLLNICALDVNMGCPSQDVIRIGAGPALLKRRAKLREIFIALGAWRRSSVLRVRAVGASCCAGRERRVHLTPGRALCLQASRYGLA